MRKLIFTTALAVLAVSATCVGIGMAAGGGVVAGTFSAWGHDFDYHPFAPQQFDVTVATEAKTGHKMNLVKLKNGHMMAMIPADRYISLMTTPSDDMVQ